MREREMFKYIIKSDCIVYCRFIFQLNVIFIHRSRDDCDDCSSFVSSKCAECTIKVNASFISINHSRLSSLPTAGNFFISVALECYFTSGFIFSRFIILRERKFAAATTGEILSLASPVQRVECVIISSLLSLLYYINNFLQLHQYQNSYDRVSIILGLLVGYAAAQIYDTKLIRFAFFASLLWVCVIGPSLGRVSMNSRARKLVAERKKDTHSHTWLIILLLAHSHGVNMISSI
jgi:hypothetical protein